MPSYVRRVHVLAVLCKSRIARNYQSCFCAVRKLSVLRVRSYIYLLLIPNRERIKCESVEVRYRHDLIIPSRDSDPNTYSRTNSNRVDRPARLDICIL